MQKITSRCGGVAARSDGQHGGRAAWRDGGVAERTGRAAWVVPAGASSASGRCARATGRAGAERRRLVWETKKKQIRRRLPTVFKNLIFGGFVSGRRK
jgi:hypothetical protein